MLELEVKAGAYVAHLGGASAEAMKRPPGHPPPLRLPNMLHTM